MDFTKPTVAIVTRVSRSADFLERVLDGLRQQTGAKLIWSIVTQKPLTSSHISCINYAKVYGIDVIVTQGNPKDSLGKLLNIGVNAVYSSHVLVHDDDDFMNKDFVSSAIKILSKQSCVAVACHAAIIHERPKKNVLNYILSPGRKKVCLQDLCTDNLIVVNGLIYNRTAFNAIGGYDEDVEVAEDWLFNIKLRKHGEILVFNRVCATVFVRDNEYNYATEAHTNKQKHQEMRSTIINAQGASNLPSLEERTNTSIQKIRRQLDRLVFSLSEKYLPR